MIGSRSFCVHNAYLCFALREGAVGGLEIFRQALSHTNSSLVSVYPLANGMHTYSQSGSGRGVCLP